MEYSEGVKLVASIISFIIGIFVIALMITVHESGHFLAARLVNVKVKTFAIGFGKAIKKWRSNGVEYRLNIFPLGGYCQIASEGENSLFAVNPFKRIVVYIAGAFFNLIFAFVVFTPFFMMNYTTISYPNQIVVAQDYPTLFGPNNNATNFKTGDTIISIDGNKVNDFEEIESLLSKNKNEVVEFVVIRDNKELKFSQKGIYNKELNKILFGVSYYLEPVVGDIDPNGIEALFNLEIGDRIISFNNYEINNSFDFLTVLATNPSSINLVVQKSSNQIKEISFTPLRDPNGNIELRFDFDKEFKQLKGQNIFSSIKSALVETSKQFIETFKLIFSLFSTKSDVDNSVAGPIRISYIIGSMRTSGIRAILHVTALVSISLAAANCLPLPGLDGGHILLNIVELIRGKRLPMSLYLNFQKVGLVILLLLMIFVVSTDLKFLFSSLISPF
ncbi:MAG: RIP metalloprotease RseP [Sphaerochaetaceae bacterium]|jgi:regulator of sigma E protease